MLRKQRLAEKEDKYLLLSLQEPLRLKTACCSLRASTLNPKFCISPANSHVCFTPESGHVRCTSECPLRANSGHGARRCLTGPARQNPSDVVQVHRDSAV